MPSRIVREGIITSVPVNSLSWAAELFYRRLFNVADDFGRYYAHPTLLKAACYPLQLEKVSDSDIGKFLLECEKAGLVRVYSVQDKRFLEIYKFGQQVRAKFSKFPCLSDATLPQQQLRTKPKPITEAEGACASESGAGVEAGNGNGGGGLAGDLVRAGSAGGLVGGALDDYTRRAQLNAFFVLLEDEFGTGKGVNETVRNNWLDRPEITINKVQRALEQARKKPGVNNIVGMMVTIADPKRSNGARR